MSGIDIMREFLKASPYVLHLGIAVEGLEPDHARLTLPFRTELITIGQMVHGGAIGSLIDTAAMAAAWCTDDPPANMRGTTVALSTTFVAAANACDLTADARVVRRGRSLVNLEVDVLDPHGTVVAKGLVTYKLG